MHLLSGVIEWPLTAAILVSGGTMDLRECLSLFEELGLAPNCSVSVDHLALPELAVIVSAVAVVAATIIAYFQLKSLRDGTLSQVKTLIGTTQSQKEAMAHNARLRATLDLIVHVSVDGEWRTWRQNFIKIRDSKDGLKKYAADPELARSVEALDIRTQLNLYELVALGIQDGILDEAMYKKYYRGTVIKDFDASREYIAIERGENAKYWILFEGLVEHWRKNP